MSPARTSGGDTDRLAVLVAAIKANLRKMQTDIDAITRMVDSMHAIARDHVENGEDG